jgi:hypothetical protein
MKKILALILIVAMTLCLTACDLDLNLNQNQDTILSEPAKEDNKNPGKDEGTKDDDVVKDTTGNSTNSTGIRQEFKDAMDAYEAFYDEYCNILKKYYANPADMTILAEYTRLMTKAVEMDEAFAKWENEDLNNEELKYYLEVNNRVMQKMLDVMG